VKKHGFPPRSATVVPLNLTAIENRNDGLFVLDHGERHQPAAKPAGATS